MAEITSGSSFEPNNPTEQKLDDVTMHSQATPPIYLSVIYLLICQIYL